MGLITRLLNWWKEHQENKKWREFYARLDRNAEGKFTKSDYIRNINTVRKAERKKK